MLKQETERRIDTLELNKVYNMDCLEGLKELEDNSIDSIVTDPPYELGFMGKKWDNTGIAYNVEVWQECLRVLKPGGHLLSFGGTRTYHRMACAIEDAGFEIRDQIQWIYGSGFPKSMNISKAIDKSKGATREVIGKRIHPTLVNVPKVKSMAFHVDSLNSDKTMESWDITDPATPEAKQWDGWGTAVKPAHEDIVVAMKPITVDDVFGEIFMEVSVWSQLLVYAAERNFKLNLRDSKEESSIAQWLVKENIDTQDALNEAMDTLRSEMITDTIDLSTILSWKNILDEGYAMMNRYTIGTKLETITTWITSNFLLSQNTPSSTASPETSQSGKPMCVSTVQWSFSAELTKLTIILPRFAQENATLKENEKDSVNNEPIVLARKPLSEKTIAANVLKWGTGGINIDACRIRAEVGELKPCRQRVYVSGQGGFMTNSREDAVSDRNGKVDMPNPLGRFPANVILDEAAGELLNKQSGQSKSTTRNPTNKHLYGDIDGNGDGTSMLHSVTKDNTQRGHNDSGGASRFFYCAKSSKSERNKGCEDLITWENTDINSLMGKLNLQLKDILEFTMQNQVDKECNMILSGSSTMEQSQKDMISTILTETKLTTILKILCCSTSYPTRESIRDALRAMMDNGINLVDTVVKLNQWKQSITNEKTEYLLGVVSAVLTTLSQIRDLGKSGNVHSTVKPIKLMEYLITLVTPPEGTVLDPFVGSGTTLVAAKELGFSYVGFELSKEYCDIANARIASLCPQLEPSSESEESK